MLALLSEVFGVMIYIIVGKLFSGVIFGHCAERMNGLFFKKIFFILKKIKEDIYSKINRHGSLVVPDI